MLSGSSGKSLSKSINTKQISLTPFQKARKSDPARMIRKGKTQKKHRNGRISKKRLIIYRATLAW